MRYIQCRCSKCITLFIHESTCFIKHQNSTVGIHSSYKTIAFSVSCRFPTFFHVATAKHHFQATSHMVVLNVNSWSAGYLWTHPLQSLIGNNFLVHQALDEVKTWFLHYTYTSSSSSSSIVMRSHVGEWTGLCWKAQNSFGVGSKSRLANTLFVITV